jgi:thioredoxin reductase (NADPH)
MFILQDIDDKGKVDIYDVAIIGSGPAGLSAGIYTGRAGLTAVIFDKDIAGGLVKENPLVENYLGFKSIKGEELARNLVEHAKEYADLREMEKVESISKGKDFLIVTEKGEYRAKSIIIATGTTHRPLGVPGEKELIGKGVSYCVTCDGYLFKGKRVAVIGGGNSGAIAAITLRDITEEVTVIEFMPDWMCEKAYEEKIKSLSIPYIKNAETLEIIGEKRVEGIKFRDRGTGREEILYVDGVFIYVGLIPQNELAKELGVELTEKGYIKTDSQQRTSLERVYAAGDITGGKAQIIVAAGQGAIAALSAYEDLRLKK